MITSSKYREIFLIGLTLSVFLIPVPLYATDDEPVLVQASRTFTDLQKLYDESFELYKKVLESDPDSIEANLGLARLYRYRGLYEEAIVAYEKVIAHDPQNIEALYGAGQCYLKNWRTEKALSALTKAVQ